MSGGGFEYVSSGGTASGTVVSHGGVQDVFGGTASASVLSGGPKMWPAVESRGAARAAGGGNVERHGAASGTKP